MVELSTSFYSEGHRLKGSLYLPDNYESGEKRPAIIANSGYQGFNEFYPKLFSRYLTAAGYVCLGFDYRGFADSEGQPGHVILSEQVEDIKNCLTFAQTRDEIDPERISLLGWGMAAPHVVQLAATDKRVKAVAALNGFYDGERWLKSTHSPEGWKRILQLIEEDRVRRVTTGRSQRVSPFLHYVLDPATAEYVNKELAPLKSFGREIDLQFTESIVGMKVQEMAAAITPRPIFIGHGRHNLLHPKAEAEALNTYANEPKELYWIEGKHNDFMYYDHQVMNQLIDRLLRFFAVPQPEEHTLQTQRAA